jgi:hypothetical protein
MTSPSHNLTSHVHEQMAPNPPSEKGPPTRPTVGEGRDHSWTEVTGDRARPLPLFRLTLYPRRVGRVGGASNDAQLAPIRE